MYKVCAYNYKKQKGTLLAKQGFGAVLYKKDRIRYVKVSKNKRIYSGKVYEYSLKTGKKKAISKTFQSSSTQISIKSNKIIYYDKNSKKRALKFK